MTTNNFDATARLFRFGERGRSSGIAIDVDNFKKLIESPDFQKDLNEGKLVGLLTHESRENCRSASRVRHLPHQDIASKSPDALWVMKGLWVDNGAVYGGLNFLKNSDAYKRFKDLYDAGTKPYVSISTELEVRNGKYVLSKIWGCDATFSPEFASAEVTQLAANFSEGSNSGLANLYFDSTDFSLREYLKERDIYRKPHVYFRTRILEVIRFMKIKSPEAIQLKHDELVRYITGYLLEWVQMSYGIPEDKFNLITDLKLNIYCQNMSALRQLQIYLNKARNEMENSPKKVITPVTQEKLNNSYQVVCDAIIEYINSQVKDKMKRL